MEVLAITGILLVIFVFWLPYHLLQGRKRNPDPLESFNDFWEMVFVGLIFICLPFLWPFAIWAAISALFKSPPETPAAQSKPGSPSRSRPESPVKTAPKYHAHANDGTIIGTFDTILDAEICGLTAAGVKAVDLPLVLHERRRLGTYGSLRDPEPARADQPKRPAAPAHPSPNPAVGA